jgi:hypothetical protein
LGLFAGAVLVPRLGPRLTRLLDRSPVDTHDIVECRHHTSDPSKAAARFVDPTALQRLIVGPLRRATRSKVSSHIGTTDRELLLIRRDGSKVRLECLHFRRDGFFAYWGYFFKADLRELEDLVFP